MVGINVLLHPTADAVGHALGILAVWATVSCILLLVGPKQRRHEAEADEFERILEAAVWPPNKEPSWRAAV